MIHYFSLLKYTYHYNYRSHISLQVAKLAKSAGVQILIFPTVYAVFDLILSLQLYIKSTKTIQVSQGALQNPVPKPPLRASTMAAGERKTFFFLIRKKS